MRTFLPILVIFASVLGGCGSSEHATTPDEAKKFAGGPMPPDAAKRFQDSQRKAAEKLAQKREEAIAKAQSGGK